jgi:hypothetical protein
MSKSSELEDFAIGLARELSKSYPASAEPKKPASVKQLAQAIDAICNRAADYQKDKRLGMLGKARVGTAFKLELKEAGYPDEFADDVTRQLLLVMSGK